MHKDSALMESICLKNVLFQLCKDAEQTAEAAIVLQKHSPTNPELD